MSAPSQQFQAPGGGLQHDTPENTTGMRGANNPALGGSEKRPDGPPQEIAGTLPNDFSLRGNMTMENKGEDKTVPLSAPGQADGNNPLSTAGRAGDVGHKADFASHEVDASLGMSDKHSIQGHGNKQNVH